METLELQSLRSKDVEELRQIARELNIDVDTLKRQELVFRIMERQTENSGFLFRQGVLEVLPDGWGFLRGKNFASSSDDIYVSQSQIKRFGLRTGDTVSGQVRPPKDTEKFYGLLRVEAVNGLDPETARQRKEFDDLTPIYPNERLVLERDAKGVSARLIDLISPIGKGQRGTIVAPPKAGKTTLLKTSLCCW